MTVRRKTSNRREPFEELKKGDKVEWNVTRQDNRRSEKKLTSPDIKGHHVAASEDNPEYLVESDKTGKEAAHKPDAPKKVESSADRE